MKNSRCRCLVLVLGIVVFTGIGCQSNDRVQQFPREVLTKINKETLSNHVFDAPIDIDMTNVTISEFASHLSKTLQTSVVIVGNHSMNYRISIHTKDQTWREALMQLGEYHSIMFYTDDRVLRIYKIYETPLGQ